MAAQDIIDIVMENCAKPRPSAAYLRSSFGTLTPSRKAFFVCYTTTMSKTVAVPDWLRELHGRKPTIAALILTYVLGCVGFLAFITSINISEIDAWRVLLAGLVFFDVVSGTVANFTDSVNRYYQEAQKSRIGFLLLHAVHPLLMLVLLQDFATFFVFLAIYTVGSGLVVHTLKNFDVRQTVAAALVVLGVLSFGFFSVMPVILYAFGALLLVKVVLGFAVRRPVR